MRTTATQLSVICSKVFNLPIALVCYGHYARLTVGTLQKEFACENGVLGENAELWVDRIHTFLDANSLR